MSDQGGNSSDAGFVRWWFGGFSCAGALTAGTLVAVLVNEEVLPTLGIALIAAIPGAILGLAVGTGVAEVLVVIAEGLGWDEEPPTSRISRFVRRMEQVTDQAGI
jgi:hypothetical protein